IVGERLQGRALELERSLDGVIGGSRELAMAKRAALRPNVVEDGSPASHQVAGPQLQELRTAKPRQDRGDNQRPITRPGWRRRDRFEKSLELVGIEPPRRRLRCLRALHIVGGVALDKSHPASEVIEAPERGEPYSHGGRRRKPA